MHTCRGDGALAMLLLPTQAEVHCHALLELNHLPLVDFTRLLRVSLGELQSRTMS
jgi:hypothetical protein